MRLNKVRVHHMAVSIVERLASGGFLQIQGEPDVVVRQLEAAITSELQVEDRLNADVRDMLKQFEREFSEGRADYQKMFTMVKQKLIKERGLIL
jgi:uncharacterized protein